MSATNTKPTGPTPLPKLSNDEIAGRLDDVANLLEDQGANQYRVQAWRAALARALGELAETGRLGTLERLHGESDPFALLASVPGIGDTLAERIHDALGIESLEELERAAHDERLARVPGLGAKRLAGIRDALATRLRARRRD